MATQRAAPGTSAIPTSQTKTVRQSRRISPFNPSRKRMFDEYYDEYEKRRRFLEEQLIRNQNAFREVNETWTPGIVEPGAKRRKVEKQRSNKQQPAGLKAIHPTLTVERRSPRTRKIKSEFSTSQSGRIQLEQLEPMPVYARNTIFHADPFKEEILTTTSREDLLNIIAAMRCYHDQRQLENNHEIREIKIELQNLRDDVQLLQEAQDLCDSTFEPSEDSKSSDEYSEGESESGSEDEVVIPTVELEYPYNIDLETPADIRNWVDRIQTLRNHANGGSPRHHHCSSYLHTDTDTSMMKKKDSDGSSVGE